MIKRGLHIEIFTAKKALGIPDIKPAKKENFQWRLPYTSAYDFFNIFFKVSTKPNCTAT
jgi:hypothetical protein